MRYPCMQKGCDLFALRDSAYCEIHQSEQEIEDRHGPIIEERAKEGVVSKVLAEADRDDNLVIAEGRRGEIPSLTAERQAEENEVLLKKTQQTYANVWQKTRAELANAVRVPLMVAHRQVFSINGVPWILEEGMNSVPIQIKQAYEEHQQMLNQKSQLTRLLRIAQGPDDSLEPKSKGYYEHVLTGYRGEETKEHIRHSKL